MPTHRLHYARLYYLRVWTRFSSGPRPVDGTRSTQAVVLPQSRTRQINAGDPMTPGRAFLEMVPTLPPSFCASNAPSGSQAGTVGLRGTYRRVIRHLPHAHVPGKARLGRNANHVKLYGVEGSDLHAGPEKVLRNSRDVTRCWVITCVVSVGGDDSSLGLSERVSRRSATSFSITS